jgi:hypothetical protein
MRIVHYSFHRDVFVNEVAGLCDVTNVFMYASMRALVKMMLFLNAALADRLKHTIPRSNVKKHTIMPRNFDILRFQLCAPFVIQ